MAQLSSHVISFCRAHLIWGTLYLDFRSTIDCICNLLVHDHSVSLEIRRERSQALLEYGEILLEKSGPYDEGEDDFQYRAMKFYDFI
jgi:hypothetical protein